MDAGALPGNDATLDDLHAALAALEQRVAALEGRSPAVEAHAAADAPAGHRPGAGLSGALVLALVGRSLLAVAGAFLLRAVTERGLLPPSAGFGLGLAYALFLTALAQRAGSRGDRTGANVHGLTALLVTFPFVWETTAVSGLVSPAGGGLALAGLTAAGLAVAWRSGLRFQYWSYTLAALATVLALGIATGAAVFYSWLLLALGVATVLFAYNRRWYLARWPVALAADLVILRLAVMTSNPGGAVAGGQPIAAATIEVLCLALLLIYLGLFTYRALVQGRGVRAFDVVQSLLVIAVGYGGAAHASRHGGGGTMLLGWGAFVVALAGYGVAFRVVRQRQGRGRAFFYFASLALLFLVLGSGLVVAGQLLAWVWIGLGLATALLGSHYDRVTLRAHSAVYLTLAAFQTGLVGAALDTFLGDPAQPWQGLGVSALVALAATAACYVLLVRKTAEPLSRARRVPRFGVAVLSLMGLGYLTVTLLVRLVAESPPDAAPAAVAVVRTGILAATAVGLALLARRPRLAELGWLVYPVLVAGLAKLVFEDLQVGNPVALTVAFAMFGGALIMAPRLLRGGRRGGVTDAAATAESAVPH